MAAGDGAAEQSRLASERVTRLRRELEQAERNAHAWTVGAAGEALVAERITELESRGWLAIHDVHWPGRPKANLDHVLVGPGGVLVVDAKNWTGDVRLHEGNLRQNGYSRNQSVASVLQQAAALSALLEPDHRRLVQGWICLVGQPELRGMTSNGIRVEGLNTLGRSVAELPNVLDPALVPTIHAYLRELLSGATSPQLLTTAQIADLSRTRPIHHRDAPATALQQRRSRPTQAPSVKAFNRRKPRGRTKRVSCLGALFRFALLLIALSVLLNVLSSFRPSVPAVPHPTPTVVRTLPTG